jgi:hypothetical protein
MESLPAVLFCGEGIIFTPQRRYSMENEIKVSVTNDGTGMKIIMKSTATDRQMELAREFYPNAIIVKEEEE